MTGTVVVAALAMAAGTALGVLLCRIVGPRLYRRCAVHSGAAGGGQL